MAATSPEQQQYPDLNPYSDESAASAGQGSINTENVKNSAVQAKDSLVNSKYPDSSQTASARDHLTTMSSAAQNTAASIANSKTVQDLQNGPVAQKTREQLNQTGNEFGNLANSRTTPSTQTATGQDLTHYHSFFYNLLSWENPRATAISYATIVLFIFTTRYIPVVRYALRFTWIVLGITAAAEGTGRLVLDQGFVSKMRPKKYYTVPRETLENAMSDVQELINFFVIEFQRLVFAENIGATVLAFFTALSTYFLIKVTPAWGLALLFTTLVYFTPLVYISNKELIDSHLENAGKIVNEQTQQVRDLAAHHSNKAYEASQATLKDYSAKAQEALGQAKRQAINKGVVSQEAADRTEEKLASAPSAPVDEPAGPADAQAHAASAEPVTEPVPAQ
ncbi:Reticulon [Teratosphaeria destructans]|uniref:Reticulon-like protein n=1 Tax=Teratosphaeria destructans TaxID=418781 RepID=A0A9W7T1U1_9PEZI|nr:Reticulon [Teratosphaeria destructans]